MTNSAKKIFSCCARIGVVGCLWICLVGWRAAAALNPDVPLAHFVVETWGTEKGLPELAVEPLLETSDGYLWIGTQEGLARFDGAQMTVVDRSNTPSMTSDFIETLTPDAQANRSTGTPDALILRDTDGFFHAVGSEQGFDSRYITSAIRAGDT